MDKQWVPSHVHALPLDAQCTAYWTLTVLISVCAADNSAHMQKVLILPAAARQLQLAVVVWTVDSTVISGVVALQRTRC